MAGKQIPGAGHGTLPGSGKSYPWMLGGIVAGAPLGILAGMAQANTVSNDLLPLLTGAIGGAILFAAVLGGLGWLMDQRRNRSRG